MDHHEDSWSPLVLILGAMVLTFAVQRIILHWFSHPNFHVYLGGFRVHHLFTGAIIQIASSFLLAFGVRSGPRRNLTLIALGLGSAMVLDEIIYLVFTDGSNEAYRGSVSLWGAAALITMATLYLVALHVRARRR